MSGGTTAVAIRAAAGGEEYDQYVSFMLGTEEYAVSIARVQEIKGWDTVTRVPHSPRYVLGVVNLRGSIVPVIDLRIRFGLTQAPFDAKTVIVVVRVSAERGERTVGVVVDAVNDVHSIPEGQISPSPEIPGAVDRVFLRGIARLEQKLILLLDIEAVVNSCILGVATELPGMRRSCA